MDTILIPNREPPTKGYRSDPWMNSSYQYVSQVPPATAKGASLDMRTETENMWQLKASDNTERRPNKGKRYLFLEGFGSENEKETSEIDAKNGCSGVVFTCVFCQGRNQSADCDLITDRTLSFILY